MAKKKIRNAERDYPLLRELHARLVMEGALRRHGAFALGIGRKLVAGRPTNRLALRFYTTCKRPASRLAPGERVPAKMRVFSRQARREVTLLTDVIESSRGVPHAIDPNDVVRPVRGGVQCKAEDYPGFGTIGGWVWDKTDDTIVMLSNQHVFGHTPGRTLFQPTAGDPANRIGEVKRGVPLVPYVPPDDLSDCNYVDAAIAEADSSELFHLTVLEVGPAVYETATPVVGMTVEKFGQTTGHTIGEIDDVDVYATTDYPVEGEVALCDCIRFHTEDADQMPLSSFGDSGSLVFEEGPPGVTQAAVGLLYGGGEQTNNDWAWACKIQRVFGELDLGTLCDGGFAAFLDALFEAESEGRVGPEAAARLEAVSAAAPRAAPVFTLGDRRHAAARRFHGGLARDVQARLGASRRGRRVNRFVDRHRTELLPLLARDGDARRATVAALAPILAGATTSTDVLERCLTGEDLDRLERLARVVGDKTGGRLRSALGMLRSLVRRAEGRSIASVLGLDV